jgi:hypothetical protein
MGVPMRQARKIDGCGFLSIYLRHYFDASNLGVHFHNYFWHLMLLDSRVSRPKETRCAWAELLVLS